MTPGIRILLSLVLVVTPAAAADDLAGLSERFWRWRAEAQPLTGDDIPRIARPAGWVPDWSAAAVARRRTALAGFERDSSGGAAALPPGDARSEDVFSVMVGCVENRRSGRGDGRLPWTAGR